MPDTPQLFRLNVEVADLEAAIRFYDTLLGIAGRRDRGARAYYDCGPVMLQVVEVAPPHTAAKALYFTVKDLEAVFARAKSLNCLSTEAVHDASGGEIAVRPWRERSFYADDPWGNPLCFVEEGTVYSGPRV